MWDDKDIYLEKHKFINNPNNYIDKIIETNVIKKSFEDRVEYKLKGLLHREDGPAVEWKNGTKEWYIGGKLHRKDGPAIEWIDGTKEWYINGKLHREDGPAIEYHYGEKRWYIDGKLHRTNGPAIERLNGSKEWWLNDIQIYDSKSKTNLENIYGLINGSNIKEKQSVKLPKSVNLEDLIIPPTEECYNEDINLPDLNEFYDLIGLPKEEKNKKIKLTDLAKLAIPVIDYNEVPIPIESKKGSKTNPIINHKPKVKLNIDVPSPPLKPTFEDPQREISW